MDDDEVFRLLVGGGGDRLEEFVGDDIKVATVFDVDDVDSMLSLLGEFVTEIVLLTFFSRTL